MNSVPAQVECSCNLFPKSLNAVSLIAVSLNAVSLIAESLSGNRPLKTRSPLARALGDRREWSAKLGFGEAGVAVLREFRYPKYRPGGSHPSALRFPLELAPEFCESIGLAPPE
jgi:hypothetical protein